MRLFLFLSVLLSSCSSINITTKSLLPETSLPINKTPKTTPIESTAHNMNPMKPFYCFMEISASGDFSEQDDFSSKIREMALKHKADIILNQSSFEHKDSSQAVHTFSKTSYLCNYSLAYIGLVIDADGLVVGVANESPAAKNGLKKGMQILNYNEESVLAENVTERAISTKLPGDLVVVEYLDLKKNKQKKEIILESVALIK